MFERWTVRAALATAVVGASAAIAAAGISDLGVVRQVESPQLTSHVDQQALDQLVAGGQLDEAFDQAFEAGDHLFETRFDALDGGGANVGNGQRYTRVPRADLNGPGQWANHVPRRATGPNAQSCTDCHNGGSGVDDGAGGPVADAVRDPQHSGMVSHFIERNTPPTFGMGGVQRLAEEMTGDLQGIRDAAAFAACLAKTNVTLPLVSKGISYGRITAQPHGSPCSAVFDVSHVEGIDPDLVVRPFQWKGSVAFLRDFARDAGNNEIGMQGVELVGAGVDGDFDGVADELSVGDVTSFAVYMAAQPRPATTLELADLGLIPALPQAQRDSIARGRLFFAAIGCAGCHRPSLKVNVPIFSEPSQNPAYRDAAFPSGADPLSLGLDPDLPITFDLTKDQPDNVITDPQGNVIARLGSFKTDFFGRAIIPLYGDLKRHDMGPGLAESIDETGSGPSTFMTRNLWGTGSTGPWMHDGRATTLTEAILDHDGEGAIARSGFEALPTQSQKDVVEFLKSLVLFKKE